MIHHFSVGSEETAQQQGTSRVGRIHPKYPLLCGAGAFKGPRSLAQFQGLDPWGAEAWAIHYDMGANVANPSRVR